VGLSWQQTRAPIVEVESDDVLAQPGRDDGPPFCDSDSLGGFDCRVACALRSVGKDAIEEFRAERGTEIIRCRRIENANASRKPVSLRHRQRTFLAPIAADRMARCQHQLVLGTEGRESSRRFQAPNSCGLRLLAVQWLARAFEPRRREIQKTRREPILLDATPPGFDPGAQRDFRMRLRIEDDVGDDAAPTNAGLGSQRVEARERQIRADDFLARRDAEFRDGRSQRAMRLNLKTAVARAGGRFPSAR
jgi:hypothetical protein